MDERSIAKNIKDLRLDKKITLDELAQMAGLTKGYLSKIERSHKAPPFSTLHKIATALEVNITFLLKENAEELHDIKLDIVRRDERKVVVTRGSLYGYQYEALAYNKTGKNMEPYIISPAFDEKGTFQHDGEEFMYVLEGMHEFIYNGKKYILNEGDSIYFDSALPHTGWSLGQIKAKLLAVITEESQEHEEPVLQRGIDKLLVHGQLAQNQQNLVKGDGLNRLPDQGLMS